ncbi:MAG: type II toxin-antitoxin system prevent-host-death family antitoxin [Akkermansiaceae bacterium]|jgi:antitoxin YefM|nr:type II toxin-antitoxin system prevent-host-death family antitoxin [Akkermansiaceae bacterium]
MTTITYTEARDRLASVWDEAISAREPVRIERRGREAVMLVPAGEWEGLMETAHLLRSPANARRLLAALNRLENGEGQELSIKQLSATLE